MGNSGKHIFVLGAGASNASANTPLGKDLVWNYHRDHALLYRDNNGKPDQTQDNIDFCNFSRFPELAASIYPEFACLPKKWENRGWGFFNEHERMLKKHYVDEMLELLQIQGNKEGARLVKQLIFEHIAQASFNSQYTSPDTLYKRFVKKILKNRSPKTTSVISLNFDCMLQGKEFDNEVYFDYLIDFDWIDHHREEFYKRSNPIPLIKLNGSLDWGICENCGQLHLYYPSMHRTFYEEKVCANEKCGGIVTPFIVVPHEKNGEKINDLWNVAKDHLMEAHRVTIIGYSFPEYDQRVRKLFQESLNANVRLEVVDIPGEHGIAYFEEKYRKLFPDIKQPIEVTIKGFSGYLNEQGKPT